MDIKARYQAALEAFVGEDYALAIRLYRELIDADPRLSLAYQGLAEAYARQDQLDEAVSTIRQAIELEPTESLYHTSLSRFLQRQGKIPEAEQAAAEAAKRQAGGI